MNVLTWVASALLAVVLLPAGVLKLTQPIDQLAERGLKWVEDFPPALVKLIGGLEILAVLGLFLPPLLDIVPALAGFAAAGVVALMIGAAATHARRGETRLIGMNVAVLVLAVLVIVGRLA